MQRTNTHPAPPTTAHIQRSITASTFIHVLQLELHSLFRVTQSARVNLERSMTNRFKMRTSMLMANNERTTMTTHDIWNEMQSFDLTQESLFKAELLADLGL